MILINNIKLISFLACKIIFVKYRITISFFISLNEILWLKGIIIMKVKVKISLAIPVYNGGDNLEKNLKIYLTIY